MWVLAGKGSSVNPMSIIGLVVGSERGTGLRLVVIGILLAQRQSTQSASNAGSQYRVLLKDCPVFRGVAPPKGLIFVGFRLFPSVLSRSFAHHQRAHRCWA